MWLVLSDDRLVNLNRCVEVLSGISNATGKPVVRFVFSEKMHEDQVFDSDIDRLDYFVRLRRCIEELPVPTRNIRMDTDV